MLQFFVLRAFTIIHIFLFIYIVLDENVAIYMNFENFKTDLMHKATEHISAKPR